ncbi:27 kDa hemolymph glycoprotein-like [Cylas formicarius]|uniref:27 kDa hemolymph glycoprotein-like n=1 Tax=Cylas formicarius TaxID=197179 RepID=UPI002958D369|nr:27 kDa hemolymph glycoprotein-like [Cylas formicarius]
MNFQAFVLFSILGLIGCQSLNDLDLNELEKTIKENGGPDMSGLEGKLNDTKLNVEQVEKVLREKCEKQGAGDAVESLKGQQEQLKNCVTTHVNASQIQDELEEAKKTGSMDEVFAKYCKKWPDVYQCVENVTSTVRQCMSDQEEKAFNKSLNIMQELQEFMCFKDGDRLAMFVAEGGVECVQEQREGIQNCVNKTVGSRFPSPDEFSVTNLPTFLFSEQDCGDFDTVRHCIIQELDKCKDTTPSNIVDAFFKFLKKQMPCEKKVLEVKEASPQTSSSSTFFISSSMLYVIFIYRLLNW